MPDGEDRAGMPPNGALPNSYRLVYSIPVPDGYAKPGRSRPLVVSEGEPMDTFRGERMEKQILSLEEARQFAAEAAYEVNGGRLRSSCVDGRYLAEDAGAGPLARPGSDAGDMLAAMAALRRLAAEGAPLDPGALRGKVLEAAVAVAGGAENFDFHTDDHHLRGGSADLPAEDLVARGCGHLAQAERDPEAYGVAPEDVRELFRTLAELKRKGAKESVLSGDHGETAVMVLKSPFLGLRRSAEPGQAFVYQEALHRQRLAELAYRLAGMQEFVSAGIDAERFTQALSDAAGIQTGQTLRRLASGLPIYKIGPDKSVDPAGTVG